ncbi:MAG: hypothetical protein MJZ29_04040 [Bacteroidaceae bacterium]|nr:hypothetical protein [Bacteroidaceae bacterium]
MKRILLTLLIMLGMTTAFAQRLYLVKDEGGLTNLRKGPGTNYAVVDKVQDGFFVYCSNISGGWAKAWQITSDGSKEFMGYISTSKIVEPPHDGIARIHVYVIDEDGYTNIRKGKGTNTAIVGKVKDGSFILVNASDCYNGASWLRVYNQRGALRGYISARKVGMGEYPEIR